MRIQLKNIYHALYTGKYSDKPFFTKKWETTGFEYPIQEEIHQAQQKNLFEYFTHPSTFRWMGPALSGKIDFRIEGEEEKETVFLCHDCGPLVKNRIDFLRLHFKPVYSNIEIEFQLANKDKNLQDLMGRDSEKFKGSGRFIRQKLKCLFEDPAILRQMVITQQAILGQYEYRACDLRSCIIGIVDSAMTPNPDISNDGADIILINNGFLARLRTTLLNLLSRGNDAVALACLLIFAALREDAASVLFQFMGTDYDIFILEEHANPGRIELGEELYITYSERSNYKGGYRKTDITLWKYPNTMIEKITDVFGYFFYPVEIIDIKEFKYDYRRIGPQINYPCNIVPFVNDCALFEWVYQPDGGYFSDSWGLGQEDREEVVLHAYMDKNGKFITPFSVNKAVSSHTDSHCI